MNTLKPMPLTAGVLRLGRLRGSISTLDGVGHEGREHSSGLDFPSFDIPAITAARQPQRKHAPIDLRLRVDLRDVKLYVDVIVDMLLQSLDGRAYQGGLPQSGAVSRRLASNPEVRRVLDSLLGRAGKLKEDGELSPEEIIRALAQKTSGAGEADSAMPMLPLILKNIAVTREKSPSESRLGRRERLALEARRLVLAQLRVLGQNAEIVTKQKDAGSSLHIAVPDTVYRDTAVALGSGKNPGGQSAELQKTVKEHDEAKKSEGREPSPAAAPQSFTTARVEYLQNYRRTNAGATAELAEKLVDAKTLSRLSGEAAASLNRMLEQGKLVPANAAKQAAGRANTAESTITYATLYPGGKRPEKPEQKFDIIIKNLYYTEKMPGVRDIRLSALSAASLSHIPFGHGISRFPEIGVVAQRKTPTEGLSVQTRAAPYEQRGQDNPAMFFAESPAAAAAAKIEAQQAEQARQAYPAYDAPDMAKLKNELAKQAGKELDDIIRKKLNVDKLTDRIYRNLEDRLRSERIRRGLA